MNRKFRNALLFSTVAAMVTLVACEGDDIYPPGTPTGPGTTASEVGVWDGHGETVATGAQTTVAVRVTDESDRPVKGVVVTFAASDGTLAADTGSSDANGVVSTSFTAGLTAKPDTITATFPGAIAPAQVVVNVVAQQ